MILLNRDVKKFMKKLTICIPILLISVLFGACSGTSNKEDNVAKELMYDLQTTEKQAKCLIKETKTLVKKDEWNKYVEMQNARANAQDIMNNNMESFMNVGISIIGISKKCNVIF